MFVSCSNLMNLKTISSRRLFQLLDLFLGLFLLIKFANGSNLSAREDRILCKDKERQAQPELKQSLVDDHGPFSSWGIRDCCQWKGHLNFLYLSDNDFGGSQFPDFNGSLSRLRYLNIANAGLSWRILNQPGNLSRLEFLDLGGNNYSVISFDWLYHLSFLKYLDLSSNHVGENSWLKLVNKLPLHLENLQLRSCGLHGIILSQPLNGSFASLIRVINVSRNRLTSSSALKWLTNISSNLAELNLEYNNLIQASLPRCIESSLEIFNLDWNSLHGFSLASSKLVVLVLDGNQLTGPLPNFCNNAFMSLEELDISHNRFNGTVTESLGCLSRLKHLLASRNSIEVLEFQTPYLFGYGTSPYLYFLNLSNNQMSGILPDLLSPNTLLITEMDLSSNMFDGLLPLLPYINVLNLAKNRFTGSLDPFCKITSKYLTFLEVSGKLLSGELSECLFPWKQLLVLNLDNNNFSGEILTFLGSLFSLKALNLHNNNFSGEIPLSLKDCYNYVENARVRWKGNEYEYERYLGLFRVIDLSSNELTEEISNEITSLLELVAPNLSRNGLTGLIPHNINQLKQLESLNLSENHLSGIIPVTMADLTFLSYLDLYNNLSGRIPLSTQLHTFDASAFVGNALAFVGNQALCGSQVTVQCTEDNTNPNKPDHNKLENGDEFRKWFYARMRVGF
ncbi:receptor-like protein EIX1 [Gossypium raimondii]|uniref:receptor-like protein EIX1 n=1 Tax=Gossypium raimondii TaxID=29730 RepID=UPI00227BE002|nr:receptor-like protein EIX1 [Gossypium raimondii]